ncbi:hypothetical protein HZ326_26312 [Fusarium oxysporum f. sp. albedinis]|nr:hypothetical protein HZ326_26312 [Fusarium oxysporum f. sp. albedinis]
MCTEFMLLQDNGTDICYPPNFRPTCRLSSSSVARKIFPQRMHRDPRDTARVEPTQQSDGLTGAYQKRVNKIRS